MKLFLLGIALISTLSAASKIIVINDYGRYTVKYNSLSYGSSCVTFTPTKITGSTYIRTVHNMKKTITVCGTYTIIKGR